MKLSFLCFAIVSIAQPLKPKATRQQLLREAYLRLSPRFWAESLFNADHHLIPENETAEAIVQHRHDKKAMPSKRFRPFKGHIEAFQLGPDDLGFVRGAFNFDGNKHSLAMALRAAAARIGPPSVLLQLRLAKRIGLEPDENYVKISDGVNKCLGFLNTQGLHDEQAATENEETSTTLEAPVESQIEEADTAAGAEGEGESTEQITDSEESARRRLVPTAEVGQEENELYDLSMLDDQFKVEATIIKHLPARLVYGEPVDGLEKPGDSWSGRKKVRCFCALEETRRRLEVEDEIFEVLVMALDCEDLLETVEADEKHGNEFLSIHPAQ